MRKESKELVSFMLSRILNQLQPYVGGIQPLHEIICSYVEPLYQPCFDFFNSRNNSVYVILRLIFERQVSLEELLDDFKLCIKHKLLSGKTKKIVIGPPTLLSENIIVEMAKRGCERATTLINSLNTIWHQTYDPTNNKIYKYSNWYRGTNHDSVDRENPYLIQVLEECPTITNSAEFNLTLCNVPIEEWAYHIVSIKTESSSFFPLEHLECL